MAGFTLELPTLQNWSCHSCGGCCRKHLVEITEEERQRIVEQNWTPEDGVPADRPVLVEYGPPWRRRWRLNFQDDGACVFLDDKGLCRMHAKFGEPSKPLACRVYPYAFHPSGKKVTVSLRFSCPSVVENKGKAVGDQRKDLQKMAEEVVPATVTAMPAPNITSSQQVDWPDFNRFVRRLDETMSEIGVPVAVRLMRALHWINIVNNSSFDSVLGARLDDYLQLITETADLEVPPDVNLVDEPTRSGRLMFRMLSAQYARNDNLSNWESGIRGRLRLFAVGVKFARGKGNVPPLHDIFTPIPFDSLEQPFGGITEEVDEMFTRYFRVKISGLQFCGRAFFNIPFVEGFQALALVYPSMMWLARWLAAGNGREQLTTQDVADAIALADHYHGYTPQFGQRNFRRRVRMLAFTGDIARLVAWYSR